jgi:hypothetical protein
MADTPKLRREQIQDDLGAPLSYAPGVEAIQSNELPTKGYVDGIAAGALPRYDLSAQIPGPAGSYTTPTNYAAGTLEVWVNGLYQGIPASGHFSETGANTFTFIDFPLVVGMELVVRYLPS